MSHKETKDKAEDEAIILIIGAGIVGLTLALALEKHVGIRAELYEQADKFVEDVGAGMGMYPNGLRVIRDISPDLLRNIQKSASPYRLRYWERNDGIEIAVAQEEELIHEPNSPELQSIGIRRWKLQKVLYEAALAKGIKIHFGKRMEKLEHVKGGVHVKFTDGSHRRTQLVFAADGARSHTRELLSSSKMRYTNVTCTMGISKTANTGFHDVIASSSQCHAVFFPTGSNEQCFQIHRPVLVHQADPGNWSNLGSSFGIAECQKLADELEKEGWNEKYLDPIRNVVSAVKVGFCLLEPPLKTWVYKGGRVVLLGDAAHPPVPYIGQGAQMGIEDAGTIALLMRHYCIDAFDRLDLFDFGVAMTVYEKIRLPRTSDMLDVSKFIGEMKQKQARHAKYNLTKEVLLQRDVFFHEHQSILFPGTAYDYREAVMKYISEESQMPTLREEEESEKV